MNELLIELLLLRDQINHDGWIVIPPNRSKRELTVVVEWFVNDRKYTFTYHYSRELIADSKLPLLEGFAIEANREIEELLKQAEK